MKKIIIPLVLIALLIVSAIGLLTPKVVDESPLELLKTEFPQKGKPTADHSKFAILKKKFNSPREVTAACISCHTESAHQIMESNHWNWETPEYIKGRGIVYLGKKNALNNFCIGVEGNEESCAKCHIGYGMKDSQTFSYSDADNIDCLVCHDNTETYVKAAGRGGAPIPGLDLNNIAQHIGTPKRSNCGVCHFYGGGGNNVKHGDLESALFDPARDVDVHMTSDGSNLQCTDCHKTVNHVISGKMYSLSSMNRNRATCEECHTDSPHENEILNEHTLKVACQTCHIPEYAKVNATKVDWDWQTAGKLKDGQPFAEEDSMGNHSYLSIKGSFKWAKNLEPEYTWFNGTASHYLLGDVIDDTTKPVILNKLNGSYRDRDSKIIPVKIHRAHQPFDPVNRMLIQPKLYADKKGEGAFWKDFNWELAAKKGMEKVNLPFSGKISFISTEMYWPVNHMVSTKDKSLQCTDCHTSENSRLAGLTDFYMPARDRNNVVDFTGIAIILMSILGIFVHSSIRIASSRRRKRNEK